MQGDTRATGLRWIRTHGGTIYSALRRRTWPGASAVVVSVVHVARGVLPAPYDLGGRAVGRITAFLFHAGEDEDPLRLRANENKSFQGSIVLGMGFTFDDTDKSGVASPLALMHELVQKNPRNSDRIFPYIGGEEVNDSPTHAHHRYVINFGQMPLRREALDGTWVDTDERARERWLRTGVVPSDYPDTVAADWPDLVAIVEEKVKPERLRLSDNPDAVRRKAFWWQWGRYTPALFQEIRGLERVLVVSRVANAFGFAFLRGGTVYSEQLVVIAADSPALFSICQSRVHESWTRLLASSMKDDLRYTPSDCFETFPFPDAWDSNPALEHTGRQYYEFRGALMVRNNMGLTKTYNRFHDRDDRDPDIIQLRELHDAMDRTVLNAYGWTDIHPRCEFILDYEDEEDENPGKPSKKRKPWRYRWPADVRDEVLVRLLELNAERAKEEAATGPMKDKNAKRRGNGQRRRDQAPLLGMSTEE